jgi:hypothetical protein
MLFLQSHPPRRDRSFHAQTRDRRPASFGFRIWPHKCNRVRRSKFARDFAVIFGSSVFVPNKNCDRRPERSAFKNAGQNLASVLFFALGRQFALTWTTTIQFSLNFRFGNFDAWRTAVDHHADAASMGLPKCGDAKQLAKCVAHARQE